jgi:hypothetical protein
MFGASDDQVQSSAKPSIREINAKIPRKVRLDADGGFASLVLCLILIGGGTVWFGGTFYYYFAHQARERQTLNRDGREAIGKITKIRSGGGRGGGTYVNYAFRVDGTDYRDEIELEYEPESQDGELPYLNVGDPIRVQYLPSNPLFNHPSGWAWWSWWNILILQSVMVLFPGVGVVGLVNLYRERRLARIGWVTEGTVIACAPNRSRFRVDYEFCAEDKAEFDGADENCDEYETGSKIRVIYLRKNPKRNSTYPNSTYHTADE